MKDIAFIFPCYNEEETLGHSAEAILIKFHELQQSQLIGGGGSKICFVDDGSNDHTWALIEKLSGQEVIGIKLSRNFGHQNALVAGLDTLRGQFDAYITMDVDL